MFHSVALLWQFDMQHRSNPYSQWLHFFCFFPQIVVEWGVWRLCLSPCSNKVPPVSLMDKLKTTVATVCTLPSFVVLSTSLTCDTQQVCLSSPWSMLWKTSQTYDKGFFRYSELFRNQDAYICEERQSIHRRHAKALPQVCRQICICRKLSWSLLLKHMLRPASIAHCQTCNVLHLHHFSHTSVHKVWQLMSIIHYDQAAGKKLQATMKMLPSILRSSLTVVFKRQKIGDTWDRILRLSGLWTERHAIATKQ